jgi:hypothetical protein
VLHLALPAPGSNEQLHEVIADLHAPMFERHRPGWKMYVIDGLADNRFAIYHKCHHALVDGESGMAILRNSLATSPRDRHIRTTIGMPQTHRPRSAPAELRKALEGKVGAGAVSAVEETNHMIVTDTVEGVRRIEKIVAEMADRVLTLSDGRIIHERRNAQRAAVSSLAW